MGLREYELVYVVQPDAAAEREQEIGRRIDEVIESSPGSDIPLSYANHFRVPAVKAAIYSGPSYRGAAHVHAPVARRRAGQCGRAQGKVRGRSAPIGAGGRSGPRCRPGDASSSRAELFGGRVSAREWVGR